MTIDVQLVPADPKALANVRSRAALAGFTLTKLHDSHDRVIYIVAKWTLTRIFATLDEVDAFIVSTGRRA